MEVKIIKPYGYCAGVVSAFKKTLQAKKAYPDKRIYLLGMLVHNEESVSLLEKEGFYLLDERKLDLKTALESLNEGDVVIFSAHGHPDEYESIACRKKLISIDATCVFVDDNVASARKDKKSGKEIIYLGSKGHLETSGFLANLPNCAFFDVKTKSFEKEKINGDAPIVYCQTTLSKKEVDDALEILRAYFPSLEMARLRCHATQLRQQAIENIDEDVPAVLILGSRFSNNSLKLAEIAKEKGKEVFLCLNLAEVRELNLKGFSSIALASGASTSQETFLEVEAYLRSL